MHFLPHVLFSVNMHTCLTLKLIVYSLGTVCLMSNFRTQNVSGAIPKPCTITNSARAAFPWDFLQKQHNFNGNYKSNVNWAHLCRMHFGDCYCRPSKTAASVVTTFNGIRVTIGNEKLLPVTRLDSFQGFCKIARGVHSPFFPSSVAALVTCYCLVFLAYFIVFKCNSLFQLFSLLFLARVAKQSHYTQNGMSKWLSWRQHAQHVSMAAERELVTARNIKTGLWKMKTGLWPSLGIIFFFTVG